MSSFVPRPDPPVRADSKCAQCKRKRRHAVFNKYSGIDAILDPFCSSSCARAFHGVPIRVAVHGKLVT